MDEKFIADLFDAQPQSVTWMKPVFQGKEIIDFLIVYCNEEGARLMNIPKPLLQGNKLSSIYPPHLILSRQVFAHFIEVYNSGNTLEDTYFNPDLKKYLHVMRSKVHDGILTIAQDRTEEYSMLKEKEKHATLTNSILDASLNAIYSLTPLRNDKEKIVDLIFTLANRRFEEITGRKSDEITGKKYLSLYPHAKENGFFYLLCHTIDTGESKHQEISYDGDGLQGWFEVSMTRMGKEEIMVSFFDITESRESKQALEQSNIYLQNLIDKFETALVILQPVYDESKIIDFRLKKANRAYSAYSHLSPEAIKEKLVSDFFPGYRDTNAFANFVHAFSNQVQNSWELHYDKDGLDVYLWMTVSTMNDELVVHITDFTHIRSLQNEIEEGAQRLKAVFDTAQSGMFTFSPERDVNGEIYDFRFVIANPMFASYVGQEPKNIEGDPGSKWFPGYLSNGVFDMYKRTYLTGEQIRKEVHYNVDGHDIYLDLMSTKIKDEVLVIFNDFTPLKQLQFQLEQKIEELKKSNRNLEEFAYAASHDLKEPIRKIHFFADKLKADLKGQLNEESMKNFTRLEVATDRMRTLIEDLLTYSQVSLRPKLLEEVDLNQLVKTVLSDLELDIDEQHASVIIQNKLPVLKAHQRQLQQLFQNLIGNSIKYRKEKTDPQIIISSRKIKGSESGIIISGEEKSKYFFRIQVSDNGIGFDQTDAEKIFQVFQRLHGNTEYRGTGVGLSIARKVAENHNGYIEAQAEQGRGADFIVLLPA